MFWGLLDGVCCFSGSILGQWRALGEGVGVGSCRAPVGDGLGLWRVEGGGRDWEDRRGDWDGGEVRGWDASGSADVGAGAEVADESLHCGRRRLVWRVISGEAPAEEFEVREG